MVIVDGYPELLLRGIACGSVGVVKVGPLEIELARIEVGAAKVSEYKPSSSCTRLFFTSL